MKITRLIPVFLMICIVIGNISYAKETDKTVWEKKRKEVIKLDRLSKHDAEKVLADNGIVLHKLKNENDLNVTYGDLVIEYIDYNDLESKNTITTSSQNVSYRLAYIDKQTNTDWEKVNSQTYGMSHWLDVTWNITIGSTTETFWKAATVLGLNPSNFYTQHQSGDYLAKSEQHTYRYRVAQVNPYGNGWNTLVSSQRVYAYAHADLRTIDKYGASVVERDKQLVGTSYASYYFDDDYLVTRAKELYEKNGILVIETHYAP